MSILQNERLNFLEISDSIKYEYSVILFYKIL